MTGSYKDPSNASDESPALDRGVGVGDDIGIGTTQWGSPLLPNDECEKPGCTRPSETGRPYCSKHHSNIFDITPQTSRDRIVREKVDQETKERLIRVEAKLDALLAALDVDVDSSDGGDGA